MFDRKQSMESGIGLMSNQEGSTADLTNVLSPTNSPSKILFKDESA